jgi:hypothetical protein
MRNFFRRLKSAWSMWTTFPTVVIPENYWTNADSKAWSLFLTSDTGVKLRHLRWNRVYLTAQQAISDRVDSTYKCGVAFGVRAMVAEEDSLLSVSLPETELTGMDKGGFRSVNR